uniref:Uncharacterized protein n=1 Tax=Molossus molossus TaxID=27622 RepID=A0A7J8BJL4_MOLMO|nr:hypothetical protein HJG59_010238 [Molossus molossus]
MQAWSQGPRHQPMLPWQTLLPADPRHASLKASMPTRRPCSPPAQRAGPPPTAGAGLQGQSQAAQDTAATCALSTPSWPATPPRGSKSSLPSSSLPAPGSLEHRRVVSPRNERIKRDSALICSIYWNVK